ncbi:MAG: FAD-binding oxidoreductase [Steroidobacteraceae bacterium]|jgi:glycine/D-amino acid oxidase-like deaminating enzyme
MQHVTSRRRFLKNAGLVGGGGLLGAAAVNLVSPLIWRESGALETNESFWARVQSPPNPALAEDLKVDVAILGGGFTGLSAAYFIRAISPHKRVVVLEGRRCGNGASGRNGAMVLTMTADRYMRFSEDPAMDKRIYDLTAANIATLEKLGAAIGIDCELETNGALQVLGTDEDLAAARDYVQRARPLGIPVEFWDRRRVADALGTEVYEGGFFDPGGGQVHPMKLVQLFKAAAQREGADVFENTMVTSVEEGREHVLLTSDGRRIRAKSLVLATNAFSARLGFLRNAIAPIREYVAVTRPLTQGEFAALGWQRRIAFNDNRTAVYYLGMTADRRIHIGGGSPEYCFDNGSSGAEVARSHVAQLRGELLRIYPRLKEVPIEASWHGVVDWSLDESPSVGCMGRHRNIFYGIGYSGHGVNLTSIFGRIIADLDAGREDAWSAYPFVNSRLPYIPNEPLRWLGVQAALAWYRLTEA